MDILFTLTYYLFLVHVARTLIFWLHLWQIKEYRLDRILVHIRETRQGRAILFGFEPLIKLAVLVYIVASIFYPYLYVLAPFMVFGIYAYELCVFVRDLVQRKVKLPIFTSKLLVIAAITVFLVFIFLILTILDKFFWIVFVDKLIPFIVASLMGLFSFPSIFFKDIQINKAIKIVAKNKKTSVIGITGSYGKGSTKEYMYTILSQKLQTIKTPSTLNTPIGIARTIIRELNKKVEVFIVEMGAYHKGDIADMCNMTHPTMGVLTAVNEQHMSLFGSIENTMRAKYELIEALPNKGISLFNGNNERTRLLYDQTRQRKKYLYYVGEKNTYNAEIFANNVVVHPTYLTFDVMIENEKLAGLRLDLVGPHHIQNVLPGIFFAKFFKMKPEEIVEAMRKIKPLYKTMEPYRAKSGALYIDDTYNANPQSVLAGIEYLSHMQGKKVMVLQPMIELGKKGKEDHYMVAKEIGNVCDILYVTNKNFLKEMKKGIYDAGNTCQIILKSPKATAQDLKTIYHEDDVIVFEGKEANAVFDLIPHEPIYHSNG
jgi:UDP-N-acetylmuramoyl-tripeptide--D-alanyl-D-alanine ligase